MSKKVGANIKCPECQYSYLAELYRTIWVEYPENKDLILNDEINSVTCPKCKFHHRLEFPFFATNVKKNFALWYEPYPDLQIDIDLAGFAKLMGPNSFHAKAPRIKSWYEFKDKLVELDNDSLKNNSLKK